MRLLTLHCCFAVRPNSHKSQKARLAALGRFKSEAVPLLLATDVASRGLDIPTVDLVINYDLPVMARDYVHRCVYDQMINTQSK